MAPETSVNFYQLTQLTAREKIVILSQCPYPWIRGKGQKENAYKNKYDNGFSKGKCYNNYITFLFMYLCAELNNQGPVTVSTCTTKEQEITTTKTNTRTKEGAKKKN
jgi:hypothetical protein